MKRFLVVLAFIPVISLAAESQADCQKTITTQEFVDNRDSGCFVKSISGSVSYLKPDSVKAGDKARFTFPEVPARPEDFSDNNMISFFAEDGTPREDNFWPYRVADRINETTVQFGNEGGFPQMTVNTQPPINGEIVVTIRSPRQIGQKVDNELVMSCKYESNASCPLPEIVDSDRANGKAEDVRPANAPSDKKAIAQ